MYHFKMFTYFQVLLLPITVSGQMFVHVCAQFRRQDAWMNIPNVQFVPTHPVPVSQEFVGQTALCQ